MLKKLFLFLFIILTIISYSIDIDFNDMTLRQALNILEKQEGIRIITLTDKLGIKINVHLKDVDLETVLRAILLPYDFDYKQISSDKYIVFLKENEKNTDFIPRVYNVKYVSPYVISSFLTLKNIENYVLDNKIVFYLNREEKYEDIVSEISKLDSKHLGDDVLIFSLFKLKNLEKISYLGNAEVKELFELYLKGVNDNLFIEEQSGVLSFSDEMLNVISLDAATTLSSFKTKDLELKLILDKSQSKKLLILTKNEKFETVITDYNGEKSIILKNDNGIFIFKYNFLNAKDFDEIEKCSVGKYNEEVSTLKVLGEYYKDEFELSVYDEKYYLNIGFNATDLTNFDILTKVNKNLYFGMGVSKNQFFLKARDNIELSLLNVDMIFKYDFETIEFNSYLTSKFKLGNFYVVPGIQLTNNDLNNQVIFVTRFIFGRYELGVKYSLDNSYGIIVGIGF